MKLSQLNPYAVVADQADLWLDFPDGEFTSAKAKSLPCPTTVNIDRARKGLEKFIDSRYKINVEIRVELINIIPGEK